TSHSSALASPPSATWAVAAALPLAPADGDVGLVLANPADAPVAARVSAADHRGVLLTDALERELAARERAGLFPADLQPGAASVRGEADGVLRAAVVVRDAAGVILDSQLVADEGSTTLAFLIAPGTATSTAIAVLNPGVVTTELGLVALAADGSVLAIRAMPALPAGATSAFAAADVFAPEVLGAVATVPVMAEQPLAGSLTAGGAAATDVARPTAPPRAGTTLGLPMFVRGEVALDTVVQVFNPGTSAATVSMQALDAGGRVLRDGPRSDSVPA